MRLTFLAAIVPCVGGLVSGPAAMLRTRGYAVVSEPIITAERIDDCITLCHSTLERQLADVEAAGCDPIEQMYRFNSICHRQRNRWDLSIPREASTSWAALIDAVMDAATPIIREAQGPAFTGVAPLMSGAVISRAGARVQRFHVDATHSHFESSQANPSSHIYNVFCPLVDISEDGDGTMFWPAPALGESSRALAKHMLDAPDSTLDTSALDAPATPAGGLVIFDYRTIHRGLANAEVGGRERPVAYVACATGGAEDEHNFPRTAIGDISLERARALPFWNRGHAAQDKLDYYTEIEGDDPFGLPPRATAPRTRGHTAHSPAELRNTARRAAQPCMLSSSARRQSTKGRKQRGGGKKGKNKQSRGRDRPRLVLEQHLDLEAQRGAAREMHAKALASSEATYHRRDEHGHEAQPNDADELPAWDCYSFPGADSGLGADDAPPGGFAVDELARVSRGPLLSAADCASIIAEAEAVDAWESSPRSAYYARQAGCLTPLSALPKALETLSPFLASRLFPAIRQAFPCGCGAASLRVSGARLVKYNATASQTQLGMHRDGPLVTATVALNGLDEYDGGGTLIEALAGGRDGGVQRVDRGHVVLHPGAVRHGGQPITRGLRYVLVFFIFDAGTVDADRYCVLQAQGHLARALRIQSTSAYRNDILRTAAATFRAAIALGASTEAAHVGLGQAMLELGRSSGDAADMDSAVDALLVAVALAPTNAHSLSTLAAALQASGRLPEALEFARAAAAADPLSVSAHNNYGLLLASLGNYEGSIREGYIVGLRLEPQNAELLCNSKTLL